MVGFYPLCAFGENRVAASIDTPLHAFLPFAARRSPASRLGDRARGERQRRAEARGVQPRSTAGSIVWVPWQRPGFELALMLRRAVEATPGCDGIILGGHGLFTWGDTQRECYLNSITTIDQMGEFIQEHATRGRPAAVRRRGGHGDRAAIARPSVAEHAAVPARRRLVEPARRSRTSTASDDALTFANSRVGGGSLPAGHELPGSFPAHAHLADVRARGTRRPRIVDALAAAHRRARRRSTARTTRRTTQSFADAGSPALRDANPSVVVIPGARAVRVRQGQARGAHHVGVLRQRHPRDGGRQRARGGRRSRRSAAAGPAARAGAASSRASTTTSRCRDSRRSASSTGRSRKPSCSACRRRRSSAARSSSSSAAAAASAARSRCRSRGAAATSSSPT